MNTATRNQVDEIIDKESHQGDTFAKVRMGNQVDWVQLED
jgi:hypothetical protein